ncbi:MAG: recombination protein RecR [Flavobacteriaceae bacterium]|nr:recombination protein RecR [Flavobacteriaceae bacterium]
MNLPSLLLEEAVNELSKFPGIGKKSALRMVLHLLKNNPEDSDKLGQAIIKMRNNIRFCQTCGNVSDHEECNICTNQLRNRQTLCVVEDLRDVMAIENTGQFGGLYHVLGGVVSPIDGIGPDKLNIESLFARLTSGEITEVVMALPATVEGDTTMFFLSKRLSDYPVRISTISRGIAVGGSLEYADEITLGRAMSGRVPYEV